MAEVGGGVDLGDRREESQRARRQRRVRSGGSGGSGGGGSGGGGGGGGGGLGARLGRAVPRDARALQRVDDPASGATTGAGAGWGAGGGCGGSCGGARLRRPFGPLLPSPLGPGHGAWRRASARVWCRTYKCVGGCDAAPLRRGDGSPPPPNLRPLGWAVAMPLHRRRWAARSGRVWCVVCVEERPAASRARLHMHVWRARPDAGPTRCD